MALRTYRGNSRSENGWPIVDRASCTTYTVAGMPLNARSGVAGRVLAAFAARYHEVVDRIDEYRPLDDWGWSFDNDVSNSNHLSGTAFDINATKYPWGGSVMHDRFPGRVAAIRRVQAEFEGHVFWGGDWDRLDEMHFQLDGGTCVGTDASPALVEFAERRLYNGRLIIGPPDWDVPASLVALYGQLGPQT